MMNSLKMSSPDLQGSLISHVTLTVELYPSMSQLNGFFLLSTEPLQFTLTSPMSPTCKVLVTPEKLGISVLH